jgi:integrase/recombinase XerD
VTERRRSREKKYPPMPTFTYKPIVHRGEKRILILFAYNAKIVAELRQKTNAQWSKTHKAWHIADTAAHRIKCKLPLENETIVHKKTIPTPTPVIQKKVVSALEKKSTIIATKTLPTLVLKPIQNKKEDRIGLFVAYNKIIKDTIKQLADAKWSEALKCWHIPCTEPSYDTMCNALKGMVIIDATILKTFLEKQQTVNGVQKIVGYKKTTSVEQVYAISQHNMQLLQRMVEQLQLKAYSPSTLRTYKNEVGIFLQTLKNKQADTLTTQDVRRYIHHCISQLNLSENTVHSRLNALKFLYEQVLGHEKFFVEIPRPKKHLQLPKVFSQNEIAAIINSLSNKKHKTMLMLAYSAGLRVSEVVQLKTYHIDSNRMTILVSEAKGKKDRIVALSPVLLVMLRDYAQQYKPKSNGYLFEGMAKDTAYSTRSLQEVLQAAKKKAGIIRPGSVHSLRHSFATHLIEKGTDVTMIQKLLGHNDLKTTLLYLHTSNKDILKIISPLDDLKLT